MKHETFSWQGVHDLKIFAQEWAPDVQSRAVIALVHGLGEHSSRYQHVAEAFTQGGFAVLAFDLPGHGRSEGKRGHSSYADILNEIDHLLQEASRRYPTKPQFLYGHSLGGALVIDYLLRRQPQIRGAVSTSPGLQPGAPLPGWQRLMAKAMCRLNPSFTMPNGLDRSNLSRDPVVIETYDKDPLVHGQISARLGMDLIDEGNWMIENAPSLSVPLLLVEGTADHLVSNEAHQRFVDRAPAGKVTFKQWEGYYHETHNEPEKQQVIQYMQDWISHHC